MKRAAICVTGLALLVCAPAWGAEPVAAFSFEDSTTSAKGVAGIRGTNYLILAAAIYYCQQGQFTVTMVGIDTTTGQLKIFTVRAGNKLDASDAVTRLTGLTKSEADAVVEAVSSGSGDNRPDPPSIRPTEVFISPVAGAAPEWMSEKAIAIGQYFVASGVFTVFGVGLPVTGSPVFSQFMFEEFEDLFGGKWAAEPEPGKMAELMIDHINAKREKLGIAKGKERVLFDMESRRELTV